MKRGKRALHSSKNSRIEFRCNMKLPDPTF
jgi:hypothetical protein